jgi:hypothetical protein
MLMAELTKIARYESAHVRCFLIVIFLQYIRLPPPIVPYILRVSIDAGTPASKRGVFKTNFPLDGGKFDRSKFVERK